ncbi:zinc-binding dehydrogenase [Desulfoluna spongiiphila]|uniref:L-erythro-3,5-diaminohexanoate dehydrogenase n=1 Tax=Desulfoluna spongiiphila TaxID=419481 RepID=A0A1G5HQ87_9BACT|nr:zinc-binding dehydrogenase [Desulfoluna spongiiphila]SCY65956.1 L-erythro-3,5-diaminohexanoate dehydrogenase [Desulfoluna spongiiphila]
MSLEVIKNGNPFGAHRVIEPRDVLPQPAQKIDNNLSRIWDNELLIDVQFLNIDSASFTQIKNDVGADDEKIKARILEIVGDRGKMHNPVTGSGGMLIGTVNTVGEKLKETCPLKEGDRIVSLVSLSLTPLAIEEILEVKKETDQVKVKAKAVLFENSLYAKLPEDMPETLALAVLDVCGAPAQTARLVKQGDTTVIIGAGGKSGILCAWEAKRRAGVTGRIIGVEYSDAGVASLKALGICDDVVKLDASDALTCYDTISALTDGKLADVIINCVNIENTELASIMMCRDKGVVYFFSMATSFTKAALGAEGIGKDVDMIIGNGYTAGHAEIALNVVRESNDIRKMYEKLYV